MRINEIKNRQVQDSVPIDYLHALPNEKIDCGQNLNAVSARENSSLKEQILAIQKAKTLLGIENLAAAQLRFNAETLLALDCALIQESYKSILGSKAQVSNAVRVMYNVAIQLSDYEMGRYVLFAKENKIVEIGGRQYHYNLSSESNCGIVSIINGKFKPSWWFESQGLDEYTINSAAKTLGYILRKGGNLLDEKNESSLIRILLTSSIKDLREAGAYTVRDTYKHGWRKRIQDTGLISAFKKEEDDYLRTVMAEAIAKADPKSILKEHSIEGTIGKFRPLTRLLKKDEDIGVKRYLAMGVADLLAAERGKGAYYSEFHERVELSTQDKIDSLGYVLTIVDQVYKKDSLVEREKEFLYYSLSGLALLVDDEAINSVRLEGRPEQTSEYEKSVLKLNQIDLFRFLKVVCVDCTSYDKAKSKESSLSIFEAGCNVFQKTLLLQAKACGKPLLYYCELKRRIDLMIEGIEAERYSGLSENMRNRIYKDRNSEGSFEPEARLRNASCKINDAIGNTVESFLINTRARKTIEKLKGKSNVPVTQIKWGNNSDFNLVFGNLLLFLEKEKDSFKNSILDLIEELNQNGLVLDETGEITLQNALDKPNEAKLKSSLASTVYSKVNVLIKDSSNANTRDMDRLIAFLNELDPSRKTTSTISDIFIHPKIDTPHGKALVLYRRLPGIRSFKDYFGMPYLKEKAVGMAAQCISNGFSKGMLLSGPRGTGKSVFAEVLASELALPLIVVEKIEDKFLFPCEDGKNVTCSVDDYFQRLRILAPCVLLIDEIDGIIPAKMNDTDSRFLAKLKDLQKSDVPIVVIGTTNAPGVKAVRSLDINEDGSSSEANKLLSEIVNPECFEILQPYYSFHQRETGVGFSREYLSHLSAQGNIIGELDLELVSRFSSGLLPAIIDTTFTAVLASGERCIPSERAIGIIRNLKLSSDEIHEHAKRIENLIGTLVSIGGKTVSGELDYKELALAGERIPISEIATLLNTIQSPLTQNSLLELFEKDNKVRMESYKQHIALKELILKMKKKLK